MSIHHVEWELDEEDEPKPDEPQREEDPPEIDHASVLPLTMPEDTEGG